MSSGKVSLFHLTTRLQLLTIFTMTTLGFYSLTCQLTSTHHYLPLLHCHYSPTWFPPPQSVLSFHFFFFLTSLFTHLYFFLALRRGLMLFRSLMPSCPLKLTDQSFLIHFLIFNFFSRHTVS